MHEVANNILWKTQLRGINNSKLYSDCITIYDQLIAEFGHLRPTPVDSIYGGSKTTHLYGKYNLFSALVTSEMNQLYNKLCNNVSLVLEQKTPYYIRCWLNKFEKGKQIGWHMHWGHEIGAFHGFYCVNTEGDFPSSTKYLIDGKEIVINNTNGLLVIGRSGVNHCSTPWENTDSRITLAFDIAPVDVLSRYLELREFNDFLPLYTF